MALESVFINDMPRLWIDLDPTRSRTGKKTTKRKKKSITACVRCRNISLALSRSAWLLRWKWLLRHQHKHQHGQWQRLREAAASEAAAVAAAEAVAVAAAAATAINKTHTFCEADAHTHSHAHRWLLPFFARARLAAQWSKAFIYATAMFPLSVLAFFCYLLPVREN